MSKIKEFIAQIRVDLKTAQWFKIFKIGICSLIALLMIFYGAAVLFREEGSFTVSLVNGGNKTDGAVISLSETADFENSTVFLSAGGTKGMTNISGAWIPDTVDDIDGSHNGDNYIAYTFYVKNSGSEACDLQEEFKIESSVKGADAAMRVRMYKDGDVTTYAKVGSGGVPEYGTVPFVGGQTVFSNTVSDLAPDEIIKYTLVIWLEGDDPECLDNIKGGNVKMSMTFSVQEPPET